ncbi:MAG: ABC transporter substrate-binding protein, partial [Thermodesulfobacteriota bacterium]
MLIFGINKQGWSLLRWTIMTVVLVLLCLAGRGAWAGEKVVLQLKWRHQFQFAGYYAALEKGLYRAAGLDVTLREGGAGIEAIEEALAGRVQYGTAGAELLLERLKGRPVVVLAAIFQHSPSVLMAKMDSGIYSPHDLAGRRIMLSPQGEPDIWAMLLCEGLTEDRYILAEPTWDLEELVDGRVDATAAYVTNTPFEMEQRGLPVILLRPRTYGVDFYGDCLFTTQEELDQHPARVARFREASLKGWEYALEHPGEIIDLLLTRYETGKTRAYLVYEAEAMRQLILPDLVPLGLMNPGRWRYMAETYARLGLTRPEYSLDGFVYEPNPKPDHTWLFWLATGLAVSVLLALSATVWLYQFNRSLRKAVTRRTTELTRLNEELRREISDKEKTEASLRRSEESLAKAQQIVKLGNWDLDLVQNKLLWSDEIYRIFGLEPQEFEATYEAFLEYVHPEDRETVRKAVDQALEEGEAYSIEHRVMRPDGSVRVVRERADIVTDSDGQPSRMVGTVHDVTELKSAEEALRISEERYRRLIENFPNGAVVMFDHELRYNFAGGAGLAAAGLSKERLEGRTIQEVFPAETCAVVELQYREALAGREMVLEVPYAGRVFEVRSIPIVGEDGRVTAGMAITQDITERKRIETELAGRRANLEEMVQARTAELEASNKKLAQEIAERRRAEEALGAAKTQAEIFAEELRQTLNISEAQRYEMEEAKMRAEKLAVEAEAANRAKSEFLANISHELRTPLNPIIGLADLLLETKLDPEQRRFLEDIRESGERLLGMITDLIELSRLEADQVKPVDQPFSLDSALESVVRDSARMAETKGLSVVRDVAPDVPRLIEGDARLLRLTLGKILGNAIKFTEKGQVTLRVVREDPRDGGLVLRFSVSDTGIGISTGDMAKLFEDFTQADGSMIRRYGGLGLGLTMARRLVDLLGGRLRAESVEGQGTTFDVLLPFR